MPMSAQYETSSLIHRVPYLFYSEWLERAPPENILRVLIVMRMLMRDSAFQKKFVVELKAIKKLCSALEKSTTNYHAYGETPFMDKILIEMTSELNP